MVLVVHPSINNMAVYTPLYDDILFSQANPLKWYVCLSVATVKKLRTVLQG